MTCERVVIIDHGRIIAEDTAEGLTRRLQEAHETCVRIAGPRAAVLDALHVLPDVVAVREIKNADDVVTVMVTSTCGDEVRRALAATVAAQGWGLLELRPLPMTLEDLFVRLVRNERDTGA